MLTKNNYIINEYLLNCDYINKYNLKSVYNVPSIKALVLEFDLKSAIKAYDAGQVHGGDNEIQIKSFIFLYFLTAFMPFINSNKLKIVKKSDKNEASYSLKAIYSNKEDLNNFLFSLFIENWNRLIRDDLKLLNFKTLKRNEYFKNDAIVLTSHLPASVFYEIDEFTNTIPGLNSREFKISLNFLLEKKINLKGHKDFVQNLPFFWISG